MKLGKIFWGLFFVAASAGIVINELGYLGELNLFTLILIIFLIPIIIKSVLKLNFGGILFPLAIIGILFDNQLGIENLTPVPILLVALLLTIGLSIMFPRKYYKCFTSSDHDEHFDNIIDSEDDSIVTLKVAYGSTIKYVNSLSLKEVNLRATCGAMKVYFDNSKVNKEGAIINLDISLSGVELYIPKEWKVINNTSVSLGGIEEKNKSRDSNGPQVILQGRVNLAGIEIVYI